MVFLRIGREAARWGMYRGRRDESVRPVVSNDNNDNSRREAVSEKIYMEGSVSISQHSKMETGIEDDVRADRTSHLVSLGYEG
jgi:hypothetical protein